MGLQLKDLVVKHEISIKEFKGKVLAVDSMNLLYQFLTTIRGADGSVLTDRNGRVTSHLIGLFSRTTALMQEGLRLVFVFDGKLPEIKRKTWEKRTAAKQEAARLFREAEVAGEMEEMRKYAARTSILSKEMVADAKRVLAALGLPIVEAPSEGEAQTAFMVKKGDAYASVSQDYDNLIFGCPRFVKNLSLTGRRRKTGTLGYQPIKPELIVLDEVLKYLAISQEQLVVLAMLIGTDYNPGGIKGIGPKKALQLVQAHGKDFADFPSLFAEAGWEEHWPGLPWQEVYETITQMPVTDSYVLEWKPLQEKKILELLVKGHDFSPERVKSRLEALREQQRQLRQKGLRGFF